MSLTRSLDAIEIRVLGTLMEKEQATPDQYPLTVNSLIAACNQKTNREPVSAYTETEVVETLDALRADVLAWRTEGARVERWEHCLDRRWHLKPASKAVITLLLLRGAQTPGELKSRSERLHGFETVGQVEEVLARLAEGGDDALVTQLPRQPGQREVRWMHRVASDEAAAGLPAAGLPAPEPPAPPSVGSPSPSATQAAPRPSAAETPGPTADLLARLDAVEGAVDELREELTALRRRLGDLE